MNAGDHAVGRRGHVGDAHVPARGRLGDDVGHQGPVDRQEAAEPDAHEDGPADEDGDRRREGAHRHPHARDETGHVDHPLAPDAIGDLRGRDRRDRRAQRHDGRRREDEVRALARIRDALRSFEVRHQQSDEEGATAEDEEARGDQEHEASLLQDVAGPGLLGDGRPASTRTVLRSPPFIEAEEQRQHRDELDDAQRDRRAREIAGGQPDRCQPRADDDAEHREQADEAAREADLERRNEVGDIALERTLGEVRAELEQDDERADRQDGVRRGDPDEEQDVEDGPHEDVRLAPPEPADRVVAEGPRDRLDEDGDDHAGALDDAEGRVLDRGIGDELLDALLEDHADPLDDRDEPQPVHGQAQEVRERQRLSRAARCRWPRSRGWSWAVLPRSCGTDAAHPGCRTPVAS